MKAVRFDDYGPTDVLYVTDVDVAPVTAGKARIAVRAAGINPGEAGIRQGNLRDLFPADFPEGEGSDFAGVVEEVASDVSDFGPGDEVIGFSDERSSHAEEVVVDAKQLTLKPASIPWPVAGSLYVSGCTAFAAVDAVDLEPGDTVAISAAAGGVGTIAVQLAKRSGATVIGLASEPNHAWLKSVGVIPVSHGNGVAERILAAAPEGAVDAFLDNFGDGYIELALQLGVTRDRINSIADFPGVEKHGVKSMGNRDAGNSRTLAALARLIDAGELEVPIAATYPLTEVRAAYEQLEHRHARGKIVLEP